MKYYKRNITELITRFNKDWSAIDWYYFEADTDNYAKKQMQITYEGKVFKNDENNLQDISGSLLDGVLETELLIEISQVEFYELWNKEFSNTYLVKQLIFDDKWKMAWYNIDYNKTAQQLYEGNLILCGTYKDVFLLEIEYKEYSNYLMYSITEGSANIKYGTVDNWDELASSVQLWINYIQENVANVYSKPDAEKIERPLKVLLDDALQDATFSMYRNMDKGVEKFRGAYLSIGEHNYANINTYIGVEDLVIQLQKGLPDNIKIQCCLFCKYSNYNVAGNDNFGDLNCFKHCKEKCHSVKSKHDMIDMFESESKNSTKVEEVFYCEEFQKKTENDFVYKSVIK